MPTVRRQRMAHHPAPAARTMPPSGRTPVACATANPATSEPDATGHVIAVMRARSTSAVIAA